MSGNDEMRAVGFYTKPTHGWTCFHCGETFTTEGAARDHFGFDCSREPACRIKVGEERGLVMALRRAEAEVERLLTALHSENGEALAALRRVQSQIGEHARDAEQSGYDKALRDVEDGKVEPDHALRITRGLIPAIAAAPLSARLALAREIVGDGFAVVGEIAAERERQTSAEGWTTAHDDGHAGGDLAAAAACYALSGAGLTVTGRGATPVAWPWDRSWWKPKDPRRDLIRAAALIVAEIERLDRAMIAAAKETQHD